MPQSPPLLILKTGNTLPAIAADHGDFERWFTRGLGLRSEDVVVIDSRHDTLPHHSTAQEHFGAVLITGSPAMVSDAEAWSVRTGEWLAEVAEHSGLPMLGVCYGHQLLAAALGGEVGNNPRGREIGTHRVHLHPQAEQDPLFRIYAAPAMQPLRVQMSHSQSVLRLPPEAIPLAYNTHDAHQAYRWRERVWGVQFHPEFDASIVRGYIRGRWDALAREGLDAERLSQHADDSEHGDLLLQRFAALMKAQV